jgi:putative hydrolase of the HAD superfamily
MPRLRAVLFDVYGTLLTSASGDIDASPEQDAGRAAEAAFAAVDISLPFSGDVAAEDLRHGILADHQQARAAGTDFPEVDIREIWGRVLLAWQRSGRLDVEASDIDIERLAVEYEMRVNPVWPMPDASECLHELQQQGVVVGLVSNAQFYTPVVLAALLGGSLTELGFDSRLRFYSYQHRRAKPDTFLYERAAEALGARGIAASETIYVGNDMRNDMLPAQRAGFRTALFAGDARSLRLREDDDLACDVKPDAIVTSLRDVLRCLPLDSNRASAKL